MYTTLQCITLRTVKYDDSRSIVTVWTRSHGHLSLIVPAGQSREARRRRALMMPLGMFEGVSDIRPGKSMHSIRDVRPLAVLPSLSSNPAKAAVAMFLCEALDRILRDVQPDDRLANFLFRSIEWLDSVATPRGVANFPLVFLCHLGYFLGIAPDSSMWRSGWVFDIDGGRFRASAPLAGRWLDPSRSRSAAMLCRLSYAASGRLAISRQVRRQMLDGVLEYFSIHHAPVGDLKSLPIVRELF